MDKKNEEIYILDRFINCKSSYPPLKKLQSELKNNRDLIETTSERPDFILKTDEKVIGIEHCLVDVLFKKKHKKAMSLVRQEKHNCEMISDSYKNNTQLLDDEIENGKALKTVIDMVQNRTEHQNEFNYTSFIENMKKTCTEHSNKCGDYRENIMLSNNYVGETYLVCLVEIPCPHTKYYIMNDDKKVWNQYIKGLPITVDILKIINDMCGFDVVIICMYDINDTNKEIKRILIFHPGEVMKDIKDQRISIIKSFDLPNAFDLPRKCKVDLDDYEYDAGKVSFTAKLEML